MRLPCPTGTIATAGGVYNPAGVPVVDSVGEQNYRVAMTSTLGVTGSEFGVNVTCHYPRGRVGGADARSPPGDEYPGLLGAIGR